MKIKGFDKDLKCRGFQFEVGKEYKIGSETISLCSDSVFHYCNSIQNVHNYYACNSDNRFCEIEAIGPEVSDDEKSGSNHIKIIREIAGEEMDVLMGKINGNTGLFNSGYSNSGYSNSGDSNSGNCNSGYSNSGNRNSGYSNSGYSNSGNWNSGYSNSGDSNSGNWNSGYSNSGYSNSGDSNSGNCNSGYRNSGNWNSGNRNSGDWNSGDRNSGNWNSGDRNSGDWNKCDYSSGVFCNKEDDDIKIFNIPSGMSLREFRSSKYQKAIYSSTFELTFIENNILQTRTYEEACKLWWDNMSEENKAIVKSIPNFSPDVFKDITGIQV